MTEHWFSCTLSDDASQAILASRQKIPAPTLNLNYCVELGVAYREIGLKVTGLVEGDEHPDGSITYRSAEPHVYVKHDAKGPYLVSVFKNHRGRPFIRIYARDHSVDVFLIKTAPLLMRTDACNAINV